MGTVAAEARLGNGLPMTSRTAKTKTAAAAALSRLPRRSAIRAGGLLAGDTGGSPFVKMRTTMSTDTTDRPCYLPRRHIAVFQSSCAGSSSAVPRPVAGAAVRARLIGADVAGMKVLFEKGERLCVSV